MPFSKTSNEHTEEYWTNHFETFLKPLIEETKELEAHRSEPLRGDILKQIITELVATPVVVADLTDRNPNVFWELGVRQSFKHCTITIAEKGTKVPFDVSVKGVLFYYPQDHIKNAKFRKKFKKAIEDCVSHPDSPDSHVLETISGRGSLFSIIHRDEMARRVEGLISEYEGNSDVIKHTYKTIDEGKGDVVTRRLRTSSVELLTTHRYLAEKVSFYYDAETYFLEMLIVNEQLGIWEHFKEGTEKWFLEEKKALLEVSKQFGKQLKAAKKRISTLY